ncbi:MAG TPA: DHHA1 domain-containing protein, partial [Acetobacteraceae bacterium]|nr:DHHA1 domain-containing protein [Acetobacteraceae bacterium]
EDKRKLERQLADLQRKQALDSAASQIETINGTKLVAQIVGDVAARDLKPLAETILKSIGSGIAALVSTIDGKTSIIVGVSPDLTPTHDAVTLVRAASQAAGGQGGGGKPNMAQAGGPDATRAAEALSAIRTALAA